MYANRDVLLLLGTYLYDSRMRPKKIYNTMNFDVYLEANGKRAYSEKSSLP